MDMEKIRPRQRETTASSFENEKFSSAAGVARLFRYRRPYGQRIMAHIHLYAGSRPGTPS